MTRLCCLLAFVTAMVMGGCSTSTSTPPISVSLSPSSPQAIDQTQSVAITATITNDTSAKGLSWNLVGPGSLNTSTGLAVSYISPTTSITSAEQATVTATSVADPTKSASVQITVNPYPQLSLLQSLANGSVGTPYSQMIELTGGTAPFQWSIYNGPIATGNYVGGGVPNGLTLNTSTGVVNGTPTGGGTWYFEVTVTDATGVTAFDGFPSIQVNPVAPPSNPIPLLNQPLVPTAIAPGGAGFALSVSGAGFVSGATIDWNGTPLTTTFVDNEHLTAMVPANNVATAGTASVMIVNPAPGGGQSNLAYFPVGPPETNVTFANAQQSPLQVPEPSAFATADFNEDGKQDLAIAAVDRVYVYLGRGDGTFRSASGSPVPLPSPPYDDFPSPFVGPMVLGDFNNSGHQGLAIGLLQNEAVDILFGNGNGTFTVADTQANTMGGPTESITAADFNADGYMDLVSLNSISGISPLALLGYGHGAFNAVEQTFQAPGVSSAAADFNGDGKLDLAIGGATILLGNGDGTFNEGVTLNIGAIVTVADFNGDGKLDLAVCNSSTNTVTILLGDGTGNFVTASGSPMAVGNNPQAIIAGDFNNDGKLDLAIANYGDNTVTLLLGNGDGTFTEASSSPYTVGTAPLALAAADFNGDGKLDLAVANSLEGTGTVSILLQQ